MYSYLLWSSSFFSLLAIPRFALFVHRDAPVGVSQRPARVLVHERPLGVRVRVEPPATKRGLVQRLPSNRRLRLLLLRRYACIEPVPGHVRRGTQCMSSLLLR